ncbi:phenylalanyl-tRNA synthetase alpha chain [Saprolegnia diclina VS20]|uniref:phenylalanine--tRNA ligase n=1 Tax=Saprolegnia diclina (strain VS20) TaxID=1156394 RepID=T0QM32_SAPDV|nr:phenylalanyl-tRNA synthetase alpha chain [Saprolegnia diclina VS20]EQC35776.1 phenylalanyl-tRNA synthetase alpha chain [Saprolegnia diclina VS20]|eukprot:XP_008610538.1 phenylalanyl-tRNA synthetase alpha chain [Saprolegnia diclina VS20]
MDHEKLAAEKQLLAYLHAHTTVADTYPYALSLGLDHALVVGVVKSLLVDAFVTASEVSTSFYVLSEEALAIMQNGSPEFQVFSAIDADGISKADLEAIVGAATFKVGQGACMKNKWIRMDKATGMIYRNVESVTDDVVTLLKNVEAVSGDVARVAKADADNLKRRKLLTLQVRKSWTVGKGPNFALERKRQAAGLNKDMLDSEAWKTETFKPYNFNTMGMSVGGGHLHPLMKVRAEFRRVLMDMGFQEMPTSRFVESSFWNFDSLFQPQSHPARDAHDTFFLTTPASANSVPEDYYERVRDMHENGGHGSIGHGRGAFTREESFKNILRTHTTAISAQMLYKLANQPGGFKPQKYFSIDRVFRNESMDATHLAEFHQVEGVVADYDLSLGDLIGVISSFFKKIGITQMRFKPAYNPYTEPSMEIFAYHPDLKRWTEIGNSGVFRPEMLRPMGLPENVRVIAWGLSLERPTMIKYRLNNIRDLFGHKVDLEQTRSAKLFRVDEPTEDEA